jgi:hypothetical protein
MRRSRAQTPLPKNRQNRNSFHGVFEEIKG